MGKTTTLGVGALIVLAALPMAAQAATVPTGQEAAYDASTAEPAPLLPGALLTEPTDHDRPSADACGGVAPDVTDCTTGSHTGSALLGGFLSHGCVGSAGYTGTIESKLVHADGERVWRCDFDTGQLESSDGSGEWPAPGQTFTQVCKSYDLGTTTPGGSGPWGCDLVHD